MRTSLGQVLHAGAIGSVVEGLAQSGLIGGVLSVDVWKS